jgi:hypothetical protein
MKIRLYEPEKDYVMLVGWWTSRKLPPVPKALLPDLGVVVEAGIPIAAGFCYFDESNRLGCVDWISTNPSICTSPTTLEAIAHVLKFFEGYAKKKGCLNLFSFIAQDTGLHRIMVQSGWQDPQGVAHRYLFKGL